MRKSIFLIGIIVVLSGCEKIYVPNISKAQSSQVIEMEKQTTVLIDIADSLKVITKEIKDGKST